MPSFQEIHDRFRPRVLRYLTRLVGEGEAEDLAQGVMLKASQGLAAFRGDSSISTWIYRIATNAAMDRLRGRKPATVSEAELETQDVDAALQSASVETAAMREEMNACIRDFIGRLPESYKTVMLLSEIEGFTNGEIADILGVSVDSVKIRLHRARAKLRQDLAAGCSFSRDAGDELTCDRRPVAVVEFRPRG